MSALWCQRYVERMEYALTQVGTTHVDVRTAMKWRTNSAQVSNLCIQRVIFKLSIGQNNHIRIAWVWAGVVSSMCQYKEYYFGGGGPWTSTKILIHLLCGRWKAARVWATPILYGSTKGWSSPTDPNLFLLQNVMCKLSKSFKQSPLWLWLECAAWPLWCWWWRQCWCAELWGFKGRIKYLTNYILHIPAVVYDYLITNHNL
jgi:hypothetical protein